MAAATPTVPEEGPAPSPSQMVLKRQHSAIPEGDNEDDEDGDMPFPDDDETAVSALWFVACYQLSALNCANLMQQDATVLHNDGA